MFVLESWQHLAWLWLLPWALERCMLLVLGASCSWLLSGCGAGAGERSRHTKSSTAHHMHHNFCCKKERNKLISEYILKLQYT